MRAEQEEFVTTHNKELFVTRNELVVSGKNYSSCGENVFHTARIFVMQQELFVTRGKLVIIKDKLFGMRQELLFFTKNIQHI